VSEHGDGVVPEASCHRPGGYRVRVDRARAGNVFLLALPHVGAQPRIAEQDIESQVKHAGIEPYFGGRLTIEGINVDKPHPRTYHWAAHEVGVPIGNCMIIAAYGWDVAGATIAGMRAALLERSCKTLHLLGPDIEISGRDMVAVADQLVAMPQ
jgi:beta-phosphoglucomutase-like phosphatase (HAD superfamily)